MFFITNYKKFATNKYKCRKCGWNKMYPNKCGDMIMGFKCFYCGTVNYPTKDKLNTRK